METTTVQQLGLFGEDEDEASFIARNPHAARRSVRTRTGRRITFVSAAGHRHRRCDARCEYAVSQYCSCQCGGRNHGAGHALDVLEAAERAEGVLV